MRARRLYKRLDELRRRVDLADARDPLVGVNPDDGSSWPPSAMPSSTTACRRTMASTSVNFTRSPGRGGEKNRGWPRGQIVTIAKLSTILRDAPAVTATPRTPRRSTSRRREGEVGRPPAGSALVEPAVGRISTSRSSPSPAATARRRSSLAGLDGDEPEGRRTYLARKLQPEQERSGDRDPGACLIHASRAYTRLWPSGANMNRSFPGSPCLSR